MFMVPIQGKRSLNLFSCQSWRYGGLGSLSKHGSLMERLMAAPVLETFSQNN